MTRYDPLVGRTGRTPQYDETGRLLLVFTVTTDTRRGRACADDVWRPDDVPVTIALEAALGSFSGWTVSTSDRALAEALLSHGSLRLRHAHLMSHDLSTVPLAPATELAIEPLSADDVIHHAGRLGEIAHKAYPPCHPDHSHELRTQAIDEIAAIGRGELLGPLMVQSRVARLHGAIVGACLLVDREGLAPGGGPWVMDLFRDPASAGCGIGRALVAATLSAAQASGLPSVSLAVSDENPLAIRLYERLGFVDVEQSWTLDLPA